MTSANVLVHANKYVSVEMMVCLSAITHSLTRTVQAISRGVMHKQSKHQQCQYQADHDHSGRWHGMGVCPFLHSKLSIHVRQQSTPAPDTHWVTHTLLKNMNDPHADVPDPIARRFEIPDEGRALWD